MLKDVSWDVKRGEKVGLVGVNGAGKTTQLQIITGALQQDVGNVIKAKPNMKIAYLTQEFDVTPTNTVREEFMSAYAEQVRKLTHLKVFKLCRPVTHIVCEDLAASSLSASWIRECYCIAWALKAQSSCFMMRTKCLLPMCSVSQILPCLAFRLDKAAICAHIQHCTALSAKKAQKATLQSSLKHAASTGMLCKACDHFKLSEKVLYQLSTTGFTQSHTSQTGETAKAAG